MTHTDIPNTSITGTRILYEFIDGETVSTNIKIEINLNGVVSISRTRECGEPEILIISAIVGSGNIDEIEKKLELALGATGLKVSSAGKSVGALWEFDRLDTVTDSPNRMAFDLKFIQWQRQTHVVDDGANRRRVVAG